MAKVDDIIKIMLRRPVLNKSGFFLVAILTAFSMTVTEGFLAIFSVASPVGANGRSPLHLKQGVFLIAVPHLLDPHFRQTVVLLIAYDKQGAAGVIINRPTEIPLEKAFPNLKGVEGLSSSLFFGGPVSQDHLMALLRSDKPLDGAQKIFDNVYVTEKRDHLSQILRDPNPEKNLRIFSGYSGWGSGQLDQEVARGDWIIITADPEIIFSENPSKIWSELLKKRERIEADQGGRFIQTASKK